MPIASDYNNSNKTTRAKTTTPTTKATTTASTAAATMTTLASPGSPELYVKQLHGYSGGRTRSGVLVI